MEWKINNDTPLPVETNHVTVKVDNITMEYQRLIADNTEVKHIPLHLHVKYTVLFNGSNPAHGSMNIYEGDQDAHTHLDELSIWSITHMVSNRLGIPHAIE